MLQHDDAVGVAERERDVVHDEDQRLVPPAEQREDLGALHPVERRDRLVADDDRAAVVERARHRGALLLPARQRAGRGEQLVRQADAARARRRPRRRRARAGHSRVRRLWKVERRSSRPI